MPYLGMGVNRCGDDGYQLGTDVSHESHDVFTRDVALPHRRE